MNLRAALDRLGRGFQRIWSWTLQRFTKRRAITEHQKETARETGVMLGIMRDAAAAGGQMTDEQRMLLVRALPGMRAREGVLLQIPNRSVIEENELQMIRREMARIEERDEPQKVRGFAALGAANPLLGLALNPMTWAIVALAGMTGWSSLTTWRLNHVKHELAEERAENRTLEQSLSDRTAERDLLKDAVVAADQLSHQTAANLEAERARASRAAAIERRRQREIQNVLTGRDPPAWSLRNDEPLPPGAGDDSPASGDPAGMPR